MKTQLLTILGALLIMSSSAFATEPSNNATGARGAGEKAEGVCDCNMSPAKLVEDNKKKHNSLLPEGYNPAPANSPNQGTDSSGAAGTQ